MKKVSIIIPHFNRSTFLEETLRSLKQQSYSNWEALVVDDGSDEQEQQIARSLCETDARIRFVPRSGSIKGAPVCRNQGMHVSEGDFFLFLDSDDLLAKKSLESRMEIITENPEMDYLVMQAAFFDQDPDSVSLRWNELEAPVDDLTRFLMDDPPWWTSSVLWRKSSILNVVEWDPEVLSYQDWDFHVKALIAGLSYTKKNIVDCYYRKTSSGQISHSGNRKDHILSRVSLFARTAEILLSEGMLDDERKLWLAGKFFGEAELSLGSGFYLPLVTFTKDIQKLTLLGRKDLFLFQTYYRIMKLSRRYRLKVISSLMYRFSRWTYPAHFVRRNPGTWAGKIPADTQILPCFASI